jgi:hypothetical protein
LGASCAALHLGSVERAPTQLSALSRKSDTRASAHLSSIYARRPCSALRQRRARQGFAGENENVPCCAQQRADVDGSTQRWPGNGRAPDIEGQVAAADCERRARRDAALDAARSRHAVSRNGRRRAGWGVAAHFDVCAAPAASDELCCARAASRVT